MERRHFMRALAAGPAVPGMLAAGQAFGAMAAAPAAGGEHAYMLRLLQRMAEPVLTLMAKGELKKKFPLELSPTWDGRDRSVAYLECFGRLMSGIAPWLALPVDGTQEAACAGACSRWRCKAMPMRSIRAVRTT